ncbi:hypothetical protein [Streptomyces sp. NPDC088725]|uniref:hypothetical protein n=1 Tax=Streptomyces sp. NPDC088725 TaxID=3365873 RepID=UPI0037F4445F
MNRRPLPLAIALSATAVLLLSACGSSDEPAHDSGKIAGADRDAGETPASPSASTSPSAATNRPAMALPSDIKENFDGWETGDSTKDAILADAGRAQSAVTYAVTQGSVESSALSFYQSKDALVGSMDYVKSFVDQGATYSGTIRYYAPKITVFDEKSAGVVYCSDESKAFSKNRKTEKVTKTPVTANSYLLYSTRLEKNAQGIWQTTDLTSERGNETCRR